MNLLQKTVCLSVCAAALSACAVPAHTSSAPSARSTAENMASDAMMTALCDKIRNDPKLQAAMGQSCAETAR